MLIPWRVLGPKKFDSRHNPFVFNLKHGIRFFLLHSVFSWSWKLPPRSSLQGLGRNVAWPRQITADLQKEIPKELSDVSDVMVPKTNG